ncbi:MAG: agmatine deiminase family protein, partial [Actinocrinis sp.]
MTTPAEHGYAMPAEWQPHERTWMAWPTEGYTLGDEPDEAYRAWSRVANTIARYEPLTMVVDPSPTATAEARRWLDPSATLVERSLDDAWMRDIGPTFLTRPGGLAATDWVFNGWGAQSWATW